MGEKGLPGLFRICTARIPDRLGEDRGAAETASVCLCPVFSEADATQYCSPDSHDAEPRRESLPLDPHCDDGPFRP